MEKQSEKDKSFSLSPVDSVPIISIPEGEPIIDVSLEVAKMEKEIVQFNKVKLISLKLTKAEDWAFMGKSLYLMDQGSENIAIAWGVHVSIDGLPQTEWLTDPKGQYYNVMVKGKAYSKRLNRFVEDIGTCSSRDKLFGMVGGKFKELEDVDLNMIRKKAVTNMYNRIIKRIAGLIGVIPKQLEEAGIKTADIPKVEFAEGGKKAEAQMTETDKTKRDKIWGLCMALGNNDLAQAKALLKKISLFQKEQPDGTKKDIFVDDIQRLTQSRWIENILKNLEDMWHQNYAEAPLPYETKPQEPTAKKDKPKSEPTAKKETQSQPPEIEFPEDEKPF